MRRAPVGRRQRGGALIIIAALLLLGIAWGAMSAMRNIAPPGQAERDVKTGAALEAAKRALLSYMVQHAARPTTGIPGQLPCPEALTYVGSTSEGDEDAGCSTFAGRLPWRTLGIDQPRDGYGEPLWYALSPAFRASPLNFSSTGSLSFTSGGVTSNVVALIIAPGAPLSTASLSGTPPAGCSAVNQPSATRNQAPLDAARFLECGNESGSFQHLGLSDWTNDRVIAITQADWIAALAPVIGDRLQREAAPALADWRSTESNANWSVRFLPGASAFSNPSSNGLCGTHGLREGLMPTARAAATTCTNWTGGSVGGLLGLVSAVSCGPSGSNYQCRYNQALSALFLIGSARVRASAPNVGEAFRRPITAADIVITPGGASISNFSVTLDPSSGQAQIEFDVSYFLAVLNPVTVTFPNLPDAALFADSRMAWFVENEWARHTYYSIAPGSEIGAASGCTFAGDVDCMTLSNLPAAHGNTDDKRFVLALMGTALAGQARSCAADADSDGTVDCNDRDQYIESRNNLAPTTFSLQTIGTAYNDRLATCPFKHVDQSGTDVVLCN